MTTTLHVRTTGSDANSGTPQRPLKTIERAIAVARDAQSPVTISIGPGTYRLSQTLRIDAKLSGLTLRAQRGASVVVLGSRSFEATWEPFERGIVRCRTPEGFEADQLFVDGVPQTLARFPNVDPTVRVFNGHSADSTSKARVATWRDPTGGFVHALHAHEWGGFHYRILGKTATNELTLEGGWQNNRQMGPHATYRFVEGVFEELDAEREWFHDAASHTLYWRPPADVVPSRSRVEAPALAHLIEIDGASRVRIEGIKIEHTTRTFMQTREPLLRSDWAIYRGGAVVFRNTRDCVVDACDFVDLGGNAVFVDGRNARVTVRRSLFDNIGANGVCFVGDPTAVRSPLFEYNERQSSAAMDREPGPKSDAYPVDCAVEDCLIMRTGRVEKQTAPVQIAMARRIRVTNCTICRVPRAGINIGDGTWGGHVVEGCDVFDTVLETGDHGSFNSWGRDRYWGLTDIDMNLGARPELAFLDAVEPTILRNNRWRCDHGWDIDLDDGSSNYEIRNNLCLNGGIKNREGQKRIVENNVIVNNSFHPHVWFQNSGDVFRHNIVFTEYKPIGVPSPWGAEIDCNLLHRVGSGEATRASVLAQQSGRDAGSLVGDALFVDPSVGDYRVRKGSPALTLGFRNFAMDAFGVRTARLKRLAPRVTLP